MRRWIVGVTAAGMCLAGACEEKSPPSGRTSPTNPTTILGKSAKTGRDVRDSIGGVQEQIGSQADALQGGPATEIGGVMFPVPSSWISQPKGGMRAAEYKVQTAEGEAVCVFFTGIGGNVASNINRWQTQIQADPGGEPKQADQRIDGMKVTLFDAVGTYTGMSAGGAPMQPQTGVRFLGAIIEAPRGPIQVRFTGPAGAVDAAEKDWKSMIFGMRGK